jgi:hypothetical protein
MLDVPCYLSTTFNKSEKRFELGRLRCLDKDIEIGGPSFSEYIELNYSEK